MSTSRLRRSFGAAVALGVLAPLGACVLPAGDGSPSSLLGDQQPPGSGAAGTWGDSSTGGRDGGEATDAHRDAPARDASAGDATTDAGTSDATSPDGPSKPAACTTGATAAFSLAWTVSGATGADGGAAGGDGGAATCDSVGGKTVDVDIVNLVTGAESSMTVSCDKLALTTCPLPRGSYAITLSLHDAAGATVSEIIAPELVVENGQTVALGPQPFEVGGLAATMGRGFALTWSIENATSGAARTCAQAGAATVLVDAGGKTFGLPCAPGAGRTPALTAGEYAVKLSLLDTLGAPLSVTGSMILRMKNGQLIFLGSAVFDVN
jgi:hypothetical protein